jgi:hypothetical protein
MLTNKKIIFILAGLLMGISAHSVYGDILRVELKVAEEDLYGEKGILSNPTQSGKKWEVSADISIKNEQGQLVLPIKKAGLRVHGGASRKRGAKKSLKIYFRKQYGSSTMGADIFGDGNKNLKKLIFRAGFNDSWNYDRDRGRNGQKRLATYLKDQIARDLHAEMGEVSLAGVYSVVYLNGNYAGIFNIVKALDEDNYKNNELDEDDISIVSSDEFKNGHPETWDNLKATVLGLDPSSEDYFSKVNEQLDLQNFATYLVLNGWLQNYDWPKHNWKAMKLGSEGKWKFYMWDAEYSFGSGAKGYRKNIDMYGVIEQQALSNPDSSLPNIASQLYKNHTFVVLMKAVFDKYKAILSDRYINGALDKYSDILSPYIENEAKLLGLDYEKSVWVRALRKMSEFSEVRSKYFSDQLNRIYRKPLKSTEGISDEIVLCKSIDFEQGNCITGVTSASMIERISQSSCREGKDWFLKNGSITIKNGCRAYFRVIW